MTKEISRLSKKTNDGKMASVEHTLQDAINSIGKAGALVNGKKVLVLALDDTDENFDVSFFQAGMNMSQCLALCEVAKSIFLQEMRYIPKC